MADPDRGDDDEFGSDLTRVAALKDTVAKAVARDRAYLIVLAGARVGEMIKLVQGEMVLGRDPSVAIQLMDDSASRRHAVLRCSDAGVEIEDLRSRNGTLVNGEAIVRRALSDGDKIQIGATTILKFTYHDALDETFQKQMYESALRDGLTKVFNKRYFTDRLDDEYRFARRHDTPLSLVLFDIDRFKLINDTHGHLAGDQVLVALARHVQETIRTEDVFARYGGEEFALLCRGVTQGGVVVLAERVRQRIATSEFRVEDVVIPVTVSLGVAGLPDISASDPTELVRAADGALYASKNGGRNRTSVATGAPRPAPPSRPTVTLSADTTQTMPSLGAAGIPAPVLPQPKK